MVVAILGGAERIREEDYDALMRHELRALVRICSAVCALNTLAYCIQGATGSQKRDIAKLKAIGIKFQSYSRKASEIIYIQKSLATIWEQYEIAREVSRGLCRQLSPEMSETFEMFLGG